MKKTTIILFFVFLIGIGVSAQTSGELSVEVTTSSTGGNYAPRNIIAIWIEDDAGNFVKTLLAYAQTRITHLNIWQATTSEAGSEFNTVDAITGATRTSHSTRSCIWDGTDFNGTLVTDGTYKVRMELTDKNNTGNYSSFPFTKGPEPENLTPTDEPSFSSISIDWLPSTTSIAKNNNPESYKAFPNPSSGKFTISGENINEVEIINVNGEIIFHNSSPTVNISLQPKGVYLLRISTDMGPVFKKIVTE
ncbi:MAG: hypothetical protein DRJ05_01965 [Bacteroidetes bacterium]|nr:MAG: hypothetical protein DRJ05_01965 [Bacteroidota bacterium]